MAAPRTHYDVLNVSPEAEPVVIEAAYRALIKKYHPDQAEGGAVPKDVAAINEAYGVLKEPARRADYDHRLWTRQQALRLAGLQAGLPPPPPRLSAWGGWLVAGLLACAVGAMALGRSLVPEPAATAAGPAEPATDKAAAETTGLFPSRAAEAPARTDPRAKRRAVVSRIQARTAAPAPRTRKARARPPAEGEARQEDEFLERQGYIY